MRGRMSSGTSLPPVLRPGRRRRPRRPVSGPEGPVDRLRRRPKQRLHPLRWLRARQGGCGCLRP
eukprot:2562509-Alexandrium_andersonii.AAC.1